MPLKPIIHLCRLHRPIGIWLLMWPCWWGVALGFSPMHMDFYKNLVIFLIGSVLLRSAGCIFNDFIDRHVDAQVTRTKSRPLAAKAVSPIVAFTFFLFLCLGAFGVFICLAPLAQIFALGGFVLLFLYPFAKRFTNWPQLILGIAFNSGVLVAYGQTTKAFLPFAIVYGAGILWTLAYDTVYAFQDYEDDMKIGVKSTAILFKDCPKVFLSLCYGGMGSLCVYLAYVQNNPVLATVCVLSTIWINLEIKKLCTKDANQCLTFFKKNQYMGLAIFLGLAFDSIFW
jgi:4-hydroxybenzoate polyprenyltransferase